MAENINKLSALERDLLDALLAGLKARKQPAELDIKHLAAAHKYLAGWKHNPPDGAVLKELLSSPGEALSLKPTRSQWEKLRQLLAAVGERRERLKARAQKGGAAGPSNLTAEDRAKGVQARLALEQDPAYRDKMRPLRQAKAANMRQQRTRADVIKGGKLGGLARAEALAPETRQEIARKAAAARWGKAGSKPPDAS